MRLAWILLATFLLAWQQPSLASANRARGTAAKTSVRPVKAARAKAHTQNQTRVRPSSRKATGFAKFGKKVAASLKMRSSVRTQNAQAQSALRSGQLSTAATTITRSPLRNAKGHFTKGPKKLSPRERFAHWRGAQAVKRAAIKQAKGRSENGDIQGTADALHALEVITAKGGKPGLFARWKKARVTKHAFQNMNKSAKNSLQQGDVDAAGQSFAFAAEMGVSARQTKKTAKNLVKESFTLAKAYAQYGNPQLTWNVLEMASAIATKGGAKFSQKKAQALVDRAFTKALPVLTTAATDAYKNGDVNQAVQLVAEARAIAQAGSAKPGRSVLRQQKRLVKNLGPNLTDFEASQAAAEAAQASAEAAP